MKENEAIETLISIRRVSGYSKKREEALDMAIAALEKQGVSAADVVEVRHAHLVRPNPYGECSVCGMLIDIRDGFNYCPNCGAKIDGGTNK